MEQFIEEELTLLGVLYSKTKKYVLLAEQMDPNSRSNIAIFKEQRDALDHIMRAIGNGFDKRQAPDPDYIRSQFHNARRHLYRAAYDALDGVGVSCKIRIKSAMEGISNDAISAVYKDYYDHVVEIDEIDRKIADYRNSKDINPWTMKNLEEYSQTVDRLSELSNNVIRKVPAFKEWQARNRKKVLIYTIAIPVVLVLLAFALKLASDFYLRSISAPPVISEAATTKK